MGERKARDASRRIHVEGDDFAHIADDALTEQEAVHELGEVRVRAHERCELVYGFLFSEGVMANVREVVTFDMFMYVLRFVTYC